MAHLTPLKPEITLYQDGFDDAKDLLERKVTGAALSELVERIEDPMVIALDGGWGTGKSFFLKCWVGQHLKEEKHQAQTVYFDAFKHDFIDEPLISLMGVIEDRFNDEDFSDPTLRKRFAGTVEVAKKFLKPALRIGAGVMSSGLSEVAVAAIGTEKIDNTVDGMLDAGIRHLGKEASNAIDELWKSEAGRRYAMEEFRASLIKLTAPPVPVKGDDAEQDGVAVKASLPKKLVIVIDELDRCRPDYALSLQEIIKHFFDVPHVHFVLGANLHELQNSVSARYGAGINAGQYLQKFVRLTMSLPADDANSITKSQKYFKICAQRMGIHAETIKKAEYILKGYKDTKGITLRDIDRFLLILSLIPNRPKPLNEQYDAFQSVLLTLALMKVKNRETYLQFISGDFKLEHISNLFKLRRTSNDDHLAFVLYQAWTLFLAPELAPREKMWANFEPTFPMNDPVTKLKKMVGQYLETFSALEGPTR